jgi:hypothetical protein
MTISLPEHRRERLLEILTSVINCKRASVQEWHRLLGELRSMSIAIPGSRGCFSFLQEALKPGAKRIKISNQVRHQLQDFLWLAKDVCDRPTHIAEVVPTPPTYYGAMDAAKAGMGGVWFPPGPPEPLALQPPRSSRLPAPTLWRQRFSRNIQDLVVSSDNPSGTITNSDLELAGTIAHDDVLANAVPVTHLTTCGLCDNTPAVSWRTKGSRTTTGPAAYLLQVSSLHRRHYRYKPEFHHIPGTANAMADDCSRLWNLNDADLLSYFNFNYPQKQSWRMHHLRPAMNSALTSSLLRQRSEPASYLPEMPKPAKHGNSGRRFAPTSMQTPTSRRWPTLSLSSKPLACGGGMGALLPAATQTELARWRTPFGLSARRFPHWGPMTPA